MIHWQHWRPSSPGWMYISDILYFEIDSGWKWSNDLLGRDSSITRTLMGESWLKNQKIFFTEWSSWNELSAWSGDNFTVHWFCMRCNESSSHCCYRCCHNGGCVQWTVHHTHTMVHTWIFNFYPVNSKYPVAENKWWSDTCDVYSWCLLVYNMSDDMMTDDHWTMVWPRTGTGAKLTSGLLPPLATFSLAWPCVMS